MSKIYSSTSKFIPNDTFDDLIEKIRMIYPIVAYGDPVLRKVTVDIDKSVDVKKLSEDMFETMYNAKGVGLAAPQVGLNLRIFVVDGRPFNEGEDMEERDKDPSLIDFKQVFRRIESDLEANKTTISFTQLSVRLNIASRVYEF